MAKAAPLGHADDRPRVHIWAHEDVVGWSHGPTGLIHQADGVGAALEDALKDLDEQPTVIFWMGRTHGR